MKNYFKNNTEKTPKPYQEQLAFPKGVKGKKVLAVMEERHKEIIDEIIKLIQSKEGVNICDIGCGPADSIIKFDQVFHDCEIIGVDASPLSIRISKENFAKHLETFNSTNDVEFLTTKTPDLSIKNKHFDLITLINVIYFWEDLDLHFQNIACKMKINSTLLIYFIEKQTLINKIDATANIFHYYDLQEISASLSKFGFVLENEKLFTRSDGQKGYIVLFKKNQ